MNFDDSESEAGASTADSAPAPSDVTNQQNDSSLATEESFEDELTAFVNERRGAKATKKPESNSLDANQDEEDSETVASQPTEEEKKPQQKHQKQNAEGRIKELHAEAKSAKEETQKIRSEFYKAQQELALERKRVEFLLRETQYLADKAQGLDPRDEQIRFLETKEQWAQEQSRLIAEHESRIREEQQKYEAEQQEFIFRQRVKERTAEIKNEMKAALENYYDKDTDTYLVSEYDLAQAMENWGLAPAEAARQIAERRIAVAAKKNSRPQSPITASISGSSSRKPSTPPKWHGDDANDSILSDILASRSRKRGM